MAKTLVVHDLIDTLPFLGALTWERFQALCTDVLYKKYNSVDSREYLVKGSKQQGIDAYSIKRGEESLTVAQCKLQQYIVNLPTERAIEIFLSVMEFAYQNKLQDGFAGHYFIEESIYESLITLAQKEHQYYTLLKSRIADLIGKFSTETFVDSMKFYLERFTQRYYESQKQEIDIEAANLIYQEGFGQTK